MGTLSALVDLLTPRERRRAVLVIGLVVLMATMEVVGVASVWPFFMLLSDPSLIETHAAFAATYDWFGFTSTHNFLLTLALLTFAFLITAAALRSLGEYAMTRFVQMRRHSLSTRLIERYLRQPYAFFLGRHSGEMSKNILTEVEHVTMFALAPVMRFAMSAMTLLAILSFLMVFNPVIALSACLVVGTAYISIFLTVRRIVARNSARRVSADKLRYTTASEALGGIKDIRILGKEDAYLKQFRAPSIEVSHLQAANLVLGQLPKYLVEAIGFGGMLLLCVVLLAMQGNDATAGEILPMLGVYAFAGYRMLPAVQGLYRATVEFKYGAASVETLHRDFSELKDVPQQGSYSPPLMLKQALTMEDVGFSYDKATAGLSGLNLDIPVGMSLGIVGGTGAGKTTLVDLVLGLLSPATGEICVDGVPITDGNLRAWQANIGYVPQNIFLTDASIAENIALGVDKPQIDPKQLRDCARMARLNDFVSTLEHGYETVVGEAGVRLSGGQRQRIGIARALYRDPDVLVFDEATSALDTITEREVMSTIEALRGTKTILMIAHRLSTVENCDRIIVLKDGKIMEDGRPDQLMHSSANFRALAGVAA